MFAFDDPIITEVAPDVFRISMYAPAFNMQFNYFLVRDMQPLLFTTGLRTSFPILRDAVARLIDPAQLRWIAFSHFEADECGALNLWLEAAPQAEPVCSVVGAVVNMGDFAIRPARGMADGEVLETGDYRFRLCSTAHLPHGWDASVLFEETQRTLLCSDLFHHDGNVEPVTESDLMDRVRAAMRQMQAGPLANYMPYTPQTDGILHRLADLNPRTLAIMHGSTYVGDGSQALRNLVQAMKENFGGQE